MLDAHKPKKESGAMQVNANGYVLFFLGFLNAISKWKNMECTITSMIFLLIWYAMQNKREQPNAYIYIYIFFEMNAQI